jgi:hypothetical protein
MTFSIMAGGDFRLKYQQLLTVLAATSLFGATAPDQPAAPELPGTICHVEVKADDKDALPAPAKQILPGYGTGGFPIRTASADAQAYFDNGMQLAHAFSHKAAIAAFRRAEALDPTCALCVWGEAWSRGPTINYPIDAKDQGELAILADKAMALAEDGPPTERALIAALQQRYHDGGGQGAGDDRFASAMDEIAKAHPQDNEIAVLTADAWLIAMIPRNKTDHIDRVMALLEGALARNPKDTGAIHFYIHAADVTHARAKAVPYAETLKALAPAASHLVHMPSHAFFWAGRYRMAEQSNLDAVEIDAADAARLKPKGGVFDVEYHQHNVQFGEDAALLAGDAANGMKLAASALELLKRPPSTNDWAQIILGQSYFIYGRFASPAEIAALEVPAETLVYDRAMYYYARGEAAVRRNDIAAVKAEIAAIRHQLDNDKTKAFSSSGRAAMEIAHLVLEGRAAMMERRFGDAEAAFRKAASRQEKAYGKGGDPPIWWYPVQRSLAASLVAENKLADASKAIDAVLERWLDDPVSLRIKADILVAQGHADAARRDLALANLNWSGDVSTLPASQL